MNLHEYQAKYLLLRYGLPIPPFVVASTEKEVETGIQELELKEAVLKVQVHAGGRGKAGGIKFAKNKAEILKYAQELIGMKIINNQTGPGGVIAKKILLGPPISIEKEFYVAATIDRSLGVPILILSPEGGMDIEEIAEKSPEKIMRVPFSQEGKIRLYHLFEIAKFMGWQGEVQTSAKTILQGLTKAFIETDASLIEINPFVLTKEKKLVAIDAKFSVDDNALFRQPLINSWYDETQYSPNEVMAKEYDLAYIGLEGEIGCLVNGAGLAMATMDIIHHYGGKPANFLDVGGGATKEKVAHGFKIILLDPKVRSIFVNIFGGIMDCGVLAEGIVQASKQDKVRCPLIVRMEGTNVDLGKKILKESGLNIITADTMEDGAIKAVKAAKG